MDLVRLLFLACWLSGLPWAVNLAGQLPGFSHRFDPGRPIGGTRRIPEQVFSRVNN
ncbi:MAG: hypothetical protein ACJA1E_001985 [Paracoccaceae bacterium]